MSEPTRLIDEASGDKLEASLVQVARSEGPSPEGRLRILAAIAGASAATDATGTAHAATGSKVAAKGMLSYVPWGVLGVVAVAVPTALWLGRGEEPKASSEQRATVAQSPAAATPEVSPLAPSEPGAPPPMALEGLPPLPTPAAASGAASGVKVQGSLADEVTQLQKAKLALKTGNGAQALTELNTYAQRFPRPTLGAEATVVRIEALRATGNAARAKSMAEGFLAQNPNSPYAARLRSLTGAR